jgi:hypothetical protein
VLCMDSIIFWRVGLGYSAMYRPPHTWKTALGIIGRTIGIVREPIIQTFAFMKAGSQNIRLALGAFAYLQS